MEGAIFLIVLTLPRSTERAAHHLKLVHILGRGKVRCLSNSYDLSTFTRGFSLCAELPLKHRWFQAPSMSCNLYRAACTPKLHLITGFPHMCFMSEHRGKQDEHFVRLYKVPTNTKGVRLSRRRRILTLAIPYGSRRMCWPLCWASAKKSSLPASCDPALLWKTSF